MVRALSGFALAAALLVAPALAQSDSSESDVELRNHRKWAISAEAGVNSLSSLIGPVATLYVHPQIAVDLGVGLGAMGYRPGMRARYAFSREKTAFFAGLGFKYGLGSGDEESEIEDNETKEKIRFQLDPGAFLDFMFGLEMVSDNGFLVIANAGYSRLLGDKVYSVSDGYTASEDAIKVLDLLYGSGILLSVSVGKVF